MCMLHSTDPNDVAKVKSESDFIKLIENEKFKILINFKRKVLNLRLFQDVLNDK